MFTWDLIVHGDMLTDVSGAAFNSSQAPVLQTITAWFRSFKCKHARDHAFPRYRAYRISRLR